MFGRCFIAGCALFLVTVLGQFARASDIDFDIANVAGATVDFNGSAKTITFNQTGNYDFQVTDSTSPASIVAALGTLSGTWNVGSITSAGTVQTAAVAGSGLFTLNDGSGGKLTANLALEDVSSYANGAAGAINDHIIANLSSVSYNGNNAAFKEIANGTSPSFVMSFQFNPGHNLTYLFANGHNNSTSYSGSYAAVPAPSTLLGLLSLGGVGLFGCVWRRRRRS